MSGSNIHHTSTFGPCKLSKLQLMGIRFVENGGDGTGAGGDGSGDDANKGGGAGDGKGGDGKSSFTPPSSQDELDRIIATRLSRERANFADYDELKQKAAERDRLIEEAKTADQKAIDAARDEGRNEVREVLAAERVSNALAKALTGRVPDAAALLDLDRKQFIKDGSADLDKIQAWVSEHSTEPEKQQKKGDPGQGRQDDGNGSISAGQSAYEARHPRKQ
jgi:hypothetical protein